MTRRPNARSEGVGLIEERAKRSSCCTTRFERMPKVETQAKSETSTLMCATEEEEEGIQ
jgi:hypothetical protein